MLTDKKKHRVVKQFSLVETAPFRAFTLIMDNLGCIGVINLESGFLGTETDIKILPVHEELLIKTSDLLYNPAPYHHEGSAYRVNLIGLILIQVCHIITCKQTVAWKQSA